MISYRDNIDLVCVLKVALLFWCQSSRTWPNADVDTPLRTVPQAPEWRPYVSALSGTVGALSAQLADVRTRFDRFGALSASAAQAFGQSSSSGADGGTATRNGFCSSFAKREIPACVPQPLAGPRWTCSGRSACSLSRSTARSPQRLCLRQLPHQPRYDARLPHEIAIGLLSTFASPRSHWHMCAPLRQYSDPAVLS